MHICIWLRRFMYVYCIFLIKRIKKIKLNPVNYFLGGLLSAFIRALTAERWQETRGERWGVTANKDPRARIEPGRFSSWSAPSSLGQTFPNIHSLRPLKQNSVCWSTWLDFNNILSPENLIASSNSSRLEGKLEGALEKEKKYIFLLLSPFSHPVTPQSHPVTS